MLLYHTGGTYFAGRICFLLTNSVCEEEEEEEEKDMMTEEPTMQHQPQEKIAVGCDEEARETNSARLATGI